MSTSTVSYDNWTREELIRLLNERDRPSIHSTTLPGKSFDFPSQPLRKIALKFCYSGWEYGGLAFQAGPTPLPTVEEVLFNAMAQTRLVNPAGGLEGCGWERCGRTDRGVSAAGQVISVWVRSALATQKADDRESEGEAPSRSRKSELRYVALLNRVLPPTIRVLAWSPVSPTFSARFACQYRHYKYFFSPSGLDLSLMRDGVGRLVGEHDFRNLCKLDSAKQITNFKRKVFRAELNPVSSTEGAIVDDTVFVLDLVGTAFLYHQVRHIMAVLFLIGTGLEHPSVISVLLNVDPDQPVSPRAGDPPLEVVDRKPEYQMADGLPLMLWECGYSCSDVHWQADGDDEWPSPVPQQGDLYHQLHSIHERSVIHTALDAHFLISAARYHSPPPPYLPLSQTGLERSKNGPVLNIPLGGGTFKRTAKYVPLLRRTRLDHVDVANERWRVGKGSRRPKSTKTTENLYLA